MDATRGFWGRLCDRAFSSPVKTTWNRWCARAPDIEAEMIQVLDRPGCVPPRYVAGFDLLIESLNVGCEAALIFFLLRATGATQLLKTPPRANARS